MISWRLADYIRSYSLRNFQFSHSLLLPSNVSRVALHRMRVFVGGKILWNVGKGERESYRNGEAYSFIIRKQWTIKDILDRWGEIELVDSRLDGKLFSLWRTSVNSTTAIESETARPKWYCSEIIVSSKAPRIPIPWCHDGSRSIHEISFFLTHFPRPWNERSLLTDTRITFAIPCFLGTETKRSCREIRSEILLSCWYLLIARNRFALLISSNEISTCVSSI